MPTAPDYLWYEHEAPVLFTFRWSAPIIGPDTASWRVYNKAPGGEMLLAEVPVEELSAEVITTPDQLDVVVVRGVSDLGVESGDSPNLTFAARRGYPVVTLGSWAVGRRTASISWVVTSRSFIAEVYWELTDGTETLTGYAGPEGKASIPVENFVGTLRFALRVRDDQDRITRSASQTTVWNVPPGAPVVEATEVGLHVIGVRVTPTEGQSPTSRAILDGPGGSITLDPPFEYLFDGLEPDTGYAFQARGVSPGGFIGPYGERVVVKTLPDPNAPPPDPVEGLSSPLAGLIDLLTADVVQYLLQLYSATRSRDPEATQILEPPIGFSAVYDYFLPIAGRFGDILRNETVDEATYVASELIDQVADPLHKLVIFCERFWYGEVWELS